MRIGIVTDHGGFALKEEIVKRLEGTSHEVVDLGAHTLNQVDDYPDFVIPLAKAIAEGKFDRGIAVCGSGVGAAVCANKIAGVRRPDDIHTGSRNASKTKPAKFLVFLLKAKDAPVLVPVK
jgi:RpiB/LacA/LacB family sugar-phosphate isomerase